MLPLGLWFGSIFIWNCMGVGGSCTGLTAASSRSEGQQHQAPGDPMSPG